MVGNIVAADGSTDVPVDGKSRSVLERLGHADIDPTAAAGLLSVGKQQVVEIARCLVTRATVVVLDEPTSSLTSQDVEHLFAVVRRLRAEGIAVIYISHFLEEIRQICDHFAVLRDGRLTGTGSLAEVADTQLVSLMVGRTVDELFPQVEHEIGEPILALDQLTGIVCRAMCTCSCTAGKSWDWPGSSVPGRTELLRSIYGLDAVTSWHGSGRAVRRSRHAPREHSGGYRFRFRRS